MNKTTHRLALSLLLSLALTNGAAAAQDARPATAAPATVVTPPVRHNLMPVPASLRVLGGRMKVDETFTAAVQGHSDERLRAGLERAVSRLERRTGLEFRRGLAESPGAANLVLQVRAAGPNLPALGDDESYALEVSERQTFVNAATVVGALRGLETFLQLVAGDDSGYYVPEVRVRDQPRFPWRGLLIDVARHWMPMEVIKRNLDGMAAVKLNVLHLHLTEDQGFRVESKTFPKLHRQGSDGLYYTHEDVREIIAYAAARGIRVVPEFDIPSHTTAWFPGHPELASAPGPYQIERRYGVFDTAMDPTREETYRFLDRFLGEMAALFPDAYMHIGGDEVTGKHWRLNAQIQAFMAKNNLADKHALQAYFNQRVFKILQKHGKRMIGWDEVLQPGLPTDVLVQSWQGQKSLAEGAKKGYSGILSSGYYLDLMLSTESHYLVDPLAPDAGLSEAEAARVLGGEACMWSEYVNAETIDSRLWPRLAAVAERLWSPREVRDVADMYRRLDRVSVQLEELGLTHETSAGKMLRRLADAREVAPLETLVELVEPVKFYRRGEVRPTTQMTPLTRLVDAARADSRTGREFASAVDAVIADAPRFESRRVRARDMLAEWRAVSPAVNVLADKSPIMREAEPLARDLSELSAAGLEAMHYLSENLAPPARWRDERLVLLDRVAKEKREVEFPILAPLRRLIHAAAELPQLRTLPPSEWKARVTKLAEAGK